MRALARASCCTLCSSPQCESARRVPMRSPGCDGASAVALCSPSKGAVPELWLDFGFDEAGAEALVGPAVDAEALSEEAFAWFATGSLQGDRDGVGVSARSEPSPSLLGLQGGLLLFFAFLCGVNGGVDPLGPEPACCKWSTTLLSKSQAPASDCSSTALNDERSKEPAVCMCFGLSVLWHLPACPPRADLDLSSAPDHMLVSSCESSDWSSAAKIEASCGVGELGTSGSDGSGSFSAQGSAPGSAPGAAPGAAPGSAAASTFAAGLDGDGASCSPANSGISSERSPRDGMAGPAALPAASPAASPAA
mmetsp:Transcript_30115/g.65723  ORF Transcript_30115/g.65723 Transcript_30115/m.65723 type:complete len:308 (-) Transcript_30115:628-1551(-)